MTLDSIIGEAFDVGVKSKKVKEQYDLMIKAFGNELDILMTLPLSNLSTINHNLSPSIVEGIRRMREGRLHITPGFDGQYGEVHIFDKEEKKVIGGGGAKALFEL